MKRKVIGMCLLLFTLYIPLGLYLNIPPYPMDEEVFVYESIPLLLNELPEDVRVKDIGGQGVRVETYNKIQVPEYYGLELKQTSHLLANNWRFTLTFIWLLCVASGCFLLFQGTGRALGLG